MIVFSPSQRKGLPASGLSLPRPEAGRPSGAAVARRALAAFFAATLFPCLCFAPLAEADVVIQSGGNVMRLRSDGAYGSEPATDAPESEVFGTGILPQRSRQFQNGTDGSESLPYGIVPEVHIPWRGGSWQRPGHDRSGGPRGEKVRKGNF